MWLLARVQVQTLGFCRINRDNRQNPQSLQILGVEETRCIFMGEESMRGRQFTAILLVFALATSGCVLGSKSLERSRLNYNRAVQRTTREELLLNLVRMRYHESEEFLSVSSITGQYTYDADLVAKGIWPEGAFARHEGTRARLVWVRSRNRPSFMPRSKARNLTSENYRRSAWKHRTCLHRRAGQSIESFAS